MRPAAGAACLILAALAAPPARAASMPDACALAHTELGLAREAALAARQAELRAALEALWRAFQAEIEEAFAQIRERLSAEIAAIQARRPKDQHHDAAFAVNPALDGSPMSTP